MRSYMYAYGYRNLGAAYDLVASLGVGQNPCGNCDRCAVRCAQGFDVRGNGRRTSPGCRPRRPNFSPKNQNGDNSLPLNKRIVTVFIPAGRVFGRPESSVSFLVDPVDQKPDRRDPDPGQGFLRPVDQSVGQNPDD